jgi:hypothetical protein
MNTKALVLFLSVASLSGCVSSNNQVYNGNVTFTWSFQGGLTCSQVTSIQINIPGEVLQNNGVYPCLTNNYPGIVLYDFVPGTYNFTVDALDARSTVLQSVSGSFVVVNGDVGVPVALQWVVGGVSVQWQISGSNCFDIPTVYVNFEDTTGHFLYPGAGDPQSCSAGLPPGAIRYDYLPPGNYVVTLQGLSSSAGVVFSNTPYPPVTITAGLFSGSQTIGSTLHP